MLELERRCTACHRVKDIEEFGVMKTNRSKRYRWCKFCMVHHVRSKPTISDEYKTMREKSQSLKNLTDDKIAVVKELRAQDLKPQAIAAKLGVPEIVIARTLKKLDKVAA